MERTAIISAMFDIWGTKALLLKFPILQGRFKEAE